ncbi:hypothetical protein E4A47_11010 [Micrococcus flavus]|nr:hypothetical protein E4A47_11010 [Micrococcus flavus]
MRGRRRPRPRSARTRPPRRAASRSPTPGRPRRATTRRPRPARPSRPRGRPRSVRGRGTPWSTCRRRSSPRARAA